MNVPTQGSPETLIAFPLGKYLPVGWLDEVVVLVFIPEDPPRCSPWWLHQFALPPTARITYIDTSLLTPVTLVFFVTVPVTCCYSENSCCLFLRLCYCNDTQFELGVMLADNFYSHLRSCSPLVMPSALTSTCSDVGVAPPGLLCTARIFPCFYFQTFTVFQVRLVSHTIG